MLHLATAAAAPGSWNAYVPFAVWKPLFCICQELMKIKNEPSCFGFIAIFLLGCIHIVSIKKLK